MSKKKVVILGAGLAGLSAAWHLQKKGINCIVFEKEERVGGLCRSKKINGFTFDYDGHLLHFRSSYVLDLLRKSLKLDIRKHARSAWVYRFDKYVPYPFQANLGALPVTIANACLKGFIEAKALAHKNGKDNFLRWIKYSFGDGIAKHFMIPYNRKFWGIPLENMTCEWVDNFVPQPTLSQVLDGYFTKKQHRLGYNASFWYPDKGGIKQLPEALEEQINDVRKGSCISAIDLKKKEFTVNGESKEKFDILISTMPLPELAKIAHPVSARGLKMFAQLNWNSIFNLNLGVEGSVQKGKHWVYFPDKETIFFRAGFLNNFAKQVCPQGQSAIYTEVSYGKARGLNQEMTITGIINGLRKNGVLGKKQKVRVRDVNVIKYGYPIYDKYYSKARREITRFLISKNIIPCGRYGNWQYMSMEDAILDGQRAAEEIKL